MDTSSWYSNLKKPKWSPPEWIFGPAWMIIYIIIFISFSTVFYNAFIGEITWLVALPFILNLIFNFSFSPIQFGLKNNFLASIDILLILVTLIWALFALWNSGTNLSWVVYANIPYLLWVSFATTLQLNITYLNRKSK